MSFSNRYKRNSQIVNLASARVALSAVSHPGDAPVDIAEFFFSNEEHVKVKQYTNRDSTIYANGGDVGIIFGSTKTQHSYDIKMNGVRSTSSGDSRQMVEW
jgi:hypothetical protein